MSSMLNKEEVTQELLKEYLDYNPNNGHLTWRKKPSKRANIGQRAGSLVPRTGYRSINLFGRSYAEHHVVWFYVYGYWSDKIIDHINQKRDDNRSSNLREVTVQQNAQNKQRRRGTKVEEAGIWFNRKRQRYVAEITMNRKKVYQQSFVDVEDAIAARQAKLKELGFGEFHGS